MSSNPSQTPILDSTRSVHTQQDLRELLQERYVSFGGLSLAQVQFSVLKCVLQHEKCIIVTPTSKDSHLWTEFLLANQNLLNSGSQVNRTMGLLPHWTGWSRDRFVNQTPIINQRLFSKHLLSENSSSIIVATMAGLLQKDTPWDYLRKFSITIKLGQEIEIEDLKVYLEDLGYHQAVDVTTEGQYCIKGAIVEVYPVNCLNPSRVEILGDQVSSVREFAVESNRSQKKLESLNIFPATDLIANEHAFNKTKQTFYERLNLQEEVSIADRQFVYDQYSRKRFQFLPTVLYPWARIESCSVLSQLEDDVCLIIPNGFDACEVLFKEFMLDSENLHKSDQDSKRLTAPFSDHFESFDSFSKRGHKLRQIELKPRLHNPISSPIVWTQKIVVKIPEKPGTALQLEEISKLLEEKQSQDTSIVIVCRNEERLTRVEDILKLRSLDFSTDRFTKLQSTKEDCVLTLGSIAGLVSFDLENTEYWPDDLFLGDSRTKRVNQASKLRNLLGSFQDVKIGQLVVHSIHGIGCYQGLKKLIIGGIEGEFLNIEYAENDRIYLPIDKLNLLQKHGSQSNENSQLDRLGSGGWDRRKQSAKKSAQDLAEKLLKIQAERSIARPRIFPSVDDRYYSFEKSFPYTETKDQLQAIDDINSDLESSKLMDRLICGDVGFGKTEVAIRAAFRTLQEGYQVVVLVPTTVLCHQHFKSFQSRLASEGYRVGQVSRFVSTLDTKANILSLNSGKLDVLVGTHKILSSGLKPPRLGLIIVDEEQKFGVAQKELLKQLKPNCDFLTLTATPIPRTLHIAMSGLRDISIINSPPQNRLSVKTFLSAFDESLIRESIEMELNRGGQTFFVHNKVEDIKEMTLFISSLVPKARVRFAHGQMPQGELETHIVDFLEQRFDVLVCTTIIESGIDMPNVNTLIINNADHFGLSQLYQMRGRVGRSSVQGYAYLLSRPLDVLSEEARLRLEIIATNQALGSGFQIASHDLDIRGTGDLLGSEQSGHIQGVGIEVYSEMLESAINELKGIGSADTHQDVDIKIPIQAYLPSDYVLSERDRLRIYKSVYSAESLEAIDLIQSDVIDQFGEIPPLGSLIFKISKIKFLLSLLGASSIAMNPKERTFEVKFGRLNEQRISLLLQFATKKPKSYRLTPDYKMHLLTQTQSSLTEGADSAIIDEVLSLLTPFATASTI
jgi:transcription-repair coupling factor (superfamily II helicase)